MIELTEKQKEIIAKCNSRLLANEEIMAAWKERYPNNFLAYDGIINYFTYQESTKKVLFILKEVNNKQNWIEEKAFKYGNSPNISAMINTNEITYFPTLKEWASIISSSNSNFDNVAIMNLTKVPGLENTNKTGNRYLTHARDNIDLLEAQYNVIEPDYIVCCMRDMEDWNIINEFTHCYDYPIVENTPIVELDNKYYFTVRSNGNKTFFFLRHPAMDFGESKIYSEKLRNYFKAISPSPDATV